MTNFEKIKNMSIEELTEFLYNLQKGYGCHLPTSCLDVSCDLCLMKWLENEVANEHERKVN